MELYLKRFFDFVLSLMLFFISVPMLAFLFLIVKITMGTPVFFSQIRPGKNGEPFKMYKFRTMSDAVDKNGNLLPDGERLTFFGKKLRSASIDELPELWNVLKGEMSFVGPRPLLMEYLPFYNEEQMKRHNVKPGITGWAQINGRNAISWEEKFNLDVWYVENQSFWLDIKILLLTVKKVFKREGISAEGEATMPKFTGSQRGA
jgi:lipopolysaccharide/colanic/teichoic acid biosynthesis glycosyltransferase